MIDDEQRQSIHTERSGGFLDIPGKYSTLASSLWAAEEAEYRIEDHLCRHISELIDHIGCDPHDQSLEIFFDATTPLDFVITEEQARIIWQMGFRCAWANFCDGTEQSLSPTRTSGRKPGHLSRWSHTAFEERRLRVAKIVMEARRPLLEQIARLSGGKQQAHL